MPARNQFSRYIGLGTYKDLDGNQALLSYLAYRFQNFVGNRYVDVQEGETLHHLSARVYQGNVDLWWVLADFNNIIDTTAPLPAGRTIIVPPRPAVMSDIVGT